MDKLTVTDKTAQEVLDLIEKGEYTTNSGLIKFKDYQDFAERHSQLYRPEEGLQLIGFQSDPGAPAGKCEIFVTDETTQIAAHRLTVTENKNIVLLNFASGRNAGGGFLRGSKAQEEDLCRCSGLYRCLAKGPNYYAYNRKYKNYTYSDNTIYTPNVPWFRKTSKEEPNDLFIASVITSPAPNASRCKDKTEMGEIENILRQRAGIILAIAQEHGHKNLLLGAWGCGIFANDPVLVADIFGTWLESPRFNDAFDHVTFAVYCPGEDKSTLEAFKERLA